MEYKTEVHIIYNKRDRQIHLWDLHLKTDPDAKNSAACFCSLFQKRKSSLLRRWEVGFGEMVGQNCLHLPVSNAKAMEGTILGSMSS